MRFQVHIRECVNMEIESSIHTLWHRRYGHIGNTGLKKLVKYNMVEGIEKFQLIKIDFCEPCIKGKMSRKPFEIRTRSERISEIIHTDVCGPISPTSYNGEKYSVTFIDDYSNFTVIYPMKGRNEVYERLKQFVKFAQNRFNTKVMKFRSDNGREYISNDLMKFFQENGTVIEYTVPYTPQQNGKISK